MLLRSCRLLLSGVSQTCFRHCSTCPTRYGSSTYSLRTHTCGELTRDHVGRAVTLYGWLSKPRVLSLKGVAFLPVHDTTGVTQIVCDLSKWQHVLDSFREKERVVKVGGVVRPRPPEAINAAAATGEIEVELDSLEVINEARHHPFATFGRGGERNREISIEQQLSERPHYLRLKHMQNNLRLRSKVGMALRELLIGRHGFVEIETPTLFRRSPEGAQEFIVPTRTPGRYFSLAQSPQQFKQLLMVAAFDRYFQFARCYRDEGQRSDRQPEFTQLDLEMSFVNSDCVMGLTEDILHSTVSSLCPHLSIPILPFPRMEYRQAMEQYGSDKPDTRYGLLIQDIGSIWDDVLLENDAGNRENGMPHFHALHVPQWEQALSDLKMADRSKAKEVATRIRELMDSYSFAVINSDTSISGQSLVQSCFPSGKPPSRIFEEFAERVRGGGLEGYQEGDLCLLSCSNSGSRERSLIGLGHWRTLAGAVLHRLHRMELDSRRLDFLWVVDFPLFSVREKKEEEEGRGERGWEVVSTHHPFTAPLPEHTHLLHGKHSLDQLSQVYTCI